MFSQLSNQAYLKALQEIQARKAPEQAAALSTRIISKFYNLLPNQPSPTGIIWETIHNLEKQILQFQFFEMTTAPVAIDILAGAAHFANRYFYKFEKLHIALKEIMEELQPHIPTTERALFLSRITALIKFSPVAPPSISNQSPLPLSADLFEPLLKLFHFLKTSLAVLGWWGSERAYLLKKYDTTPPRLNAEYLDDTVQIFLSQNNSTYSSCFRDWMIDNWAILKTQTFHTLLTQNSLLERFTHTSGSPYHELLATNKLMMATQQLVAFRTICSKQGFSPQETDFIYAHTTQSGLLGTIISAFSGSLTEKLQEKSNHQLIVTQSNPTIYISHDPSLLLEMHADVIWRDTGNFTMTLEDEEAEKNRLETNKICKLKLTIKTGMSWQAGKTLGPNTELYFVPDEIQICLEYNYLIEILRVEGLRGTPSIFQENIAVLLSNLWPAGRFGCAEIKLNQALV